MKSSLALVFSFIILSFISCKKDNPPPKPIASVFDTVAARSVIDNYSSIVSANYVDALNGALSLQTKIQAFTTAPTANQLLEVKNAWLQARIPYGQSEAFRLYGGPIDDEDGPEGLINAWPLDEAYIDYVDTSTNSVIKNDYSTGIINNPSRYPTISEELLETLNEKDGETNISTGYHAIEFLLWGQDKSSSGPGNRSHTDYTSAPNAQRRSSYLLAASALLVTNLQQLVAAWEPGKTSNYRAEFNAKENVKSSVANMLRGIGALSIGELAGERMLPALQFKDQEDEHSCFSDNTDKDIKLNVLGIANVYKGEYKKTDGTTVTGKGLADLVNSANNGTNQAVLQALTEAMAAADKIPAPFDQAVSTHPGEIETTINKLKTLSYKIVDAGRDLGITVSTDLE